MSTLPSPLETARGIEAVCREVAEEPDREPLELGLLYAANNVPVVWFQTSGNRRTTHKWSKATTDPDRLRQYYRWATEYGGFTEVWPATTMRLGIAVIDIDDVAAAGSSLDELPLTLEVERVPGRKHLWLLAPALRQWKPVADGVEVKAAKLNGQPGSVIPLPGSKRDGTIYLPKPAEIAILRQARSQDLPLGLQPRGEVSSSPVGDERLILDVKIDKGFDDPRAAACVEQAAQAIRTADGTNGPQSEIVFREACVVGRAVASHRHDGERAREALVQAGLRMLELRPGDPWLRSQVDRQVVRGINTGADAFITDKDFGRVNQAFAQINSRVALIRRNPVELLDMQTGSIRPGLKNIPGADVLIGDDLPAKALWLGSKDANTITFRREVSHHA